MKLIIAFFLTILLLTNYSCKKYLNSNIPPSPMQLEKQNEIIQTYLKEGAWNYHYVTKEWQEWIDKGLEKDSTIAYLWQQKALPYWKVRKYDLAIECYEKAVLYDREHYLSRLGFLKCVFAKQYKSALIDITAFKNEYGSTYENDHSLEFYEGLCYLGLNKFDTALACLQAEIEKQEKEHGKNWIHYLEWFYLGIAYYEKGSYQLAIDAFDLALEEYINFSDAKFWKGKCLEYIGLKEEGKDLMREGYQNYKEGYTFNEGSSLYESYPYQITWEWKYLVK